MLMSNRKFFMGILLFALLGGALNAIGIRVSEDPVSFMTILIIAILIDLNASFQ
jgi:hypothetical protein